MVKTAIIGLLAGLAIVIFLFTSKPPEVAKSALADSRPIEVQARENEPIKPIPLRVDLNGPKVSLGKKLFHDTALSRDNSISCAHCHPLSKGGADRRPHSIGINNAEVPLNAPTVLNSSLNFRQFWDGRAATLEEQADGPLQGELEMGSSWDDLLRKLRQSREYTAAFNEIYADGLQRENVKNAIAEFERSLLTPNSRFDRYLRGDDSAITEKEKEGYRRFKAYGCSTCHQGVNVGGNMFQRFGAVEDYFAVRGNIQKADFGRYNVTGQEDDKYYFKVPSLRNVALTPPYFHDGSAPTLEKAIETMARFQLGRTLSSEDIEYIASFLRTLTGELKNQ